MEFFIAEFVLIGIWVVLSELWWWYKTRKLVEYMKLAGKWGTMWDDRAFRIWLETGLLPPF